MVLDAQLKKRVLTAGVLLPCVIAVLLVGGWLSIAVALGACAVINFEFFSVAVSGERRLVRGLTVLSIALPICFLFGGFAGFLGGLAFAVLGTFCLFILEVERRTHELDYSVLLPGAFSGLAYTGVLGSLLVISAKLIPGPQILWLLLSVIFADTSAYFGGKAFGGAKLAPRISPNKTRSGALCGILGAAVGSMLFGAVLALGIDMVEAAFLGIIVGVMAIFGDLAESLIKRGYGVKDVSSLLPGHGGLLDRIDAFIFCLPLLFFLN